MAKKSTCRFILAAAALMALPAFAQAQSKLLEKANELFQSNQFAKAAELYQQALEKPEKSGTASQQQYVKAKLAYCFRVNNKMEQAEALYAEVVQDPETLGENYYYYAEVLLGNGKYQEAKNWFDKFLTIEPDHEKARLMSTSCNQVAAVPSFFPNLEIEAFAFNSPADDNAPIRWKGGILFSSDRPQDAKMLKEKSGWTGRDYLNLYYCKMRPDGSFSKPEVFSAKLSELNKNLSNAALSPNGKEIFFTRNDNQLNQQNTYSLQLFRATSTGSDRWKDIQTLPFCNPNFNYMHPALSPDGNTLFFVSNRNGGSGGTDIWMSNKNGEVWSSPENLGSVVNTPFHEGFPFMDEKGRLFFCSKGHTSFGGYDVFVTEKDQDGQWTTPRNLGRPINGPLDDISIYVEADGESGMFTSSRDGGDDDIYFFQAHPAAQPSSTPVEPEVTSPPVAAAAPADQPEKQMPDVQESTIPATDALAAAIPPSEPVPPLPAADSSMVKEAMPDKMQVEVAKIAKQEAGAVPQAISREEQPGQETAPIPTTTAPALAAAPAPAVQDKTAESVVVAAPPAATEPAAIEPATALVAAPSSPLQPAQPSPQEPEAPATASDKPETIQPAVVQTPEKTVAPVVADAPATPVQQSQAQTPERIAPAPEKPAEPIAVAPPAPARQSEPAAPEKTAPAPEKPTEPIAVAPPATARQSEPQILEKKGPALEKASAPVAATPVQQNQAQTTEKPAPAAATQTSARKQVLEKAPVSQSLGAGITTASTPASTATVAPTEEMKNLGTFRDFALKLETGSATISDRFRLDNATFDPNVWQLTPKVSLVLDQLAELMRQYPAIKIELSAHTESTGPEPLNLILSQNRAGIAQDYLVKDGIAKERIIIKAYGESMLLNHCTDDANCTREEHLVNQRFEVKILEMPERW